MEYQFLVDTYDSERLKTLNVWSMFTDDDLIIRPHPSLQRDRNALEHMIHQCLGENKWFVSMLGIDVGAPPLPQQESRLEFIKRYAEEDNFFWQPAPLLEQLVADGRTFDDLNKEG